MKNIHILPTGKPSRLKQNKITKKYSLATKGIDLTMYTPQNIYITSDEYIGLSYYLDGNLVRKGVVDDKEYWEVRKDYKKIILTTDQDLIKDGVQAIDDEFLEWFVKNPICESVEVEKYHGIDTSIAEVNAISGDGSLNWEGKSDLRDYKIIIPKEEPKTNLEKLPFPELVKEFAEYYKNIPLVEEAKQETLEEVAENNYYFESDIEMVNFISEMASTGKIPNRWSAFVAKINELYLFKQEQDKKRYSEEEVRKISLDFFYHWWNAKGSNTEQGFDKWFEQVKKK
jgi:hypothetical protein